MWRSRSARRNPRYPSGRPPYPLNYNHCRSRASNSGRRGKKRVHWPPRYLDTSHSYVKFTICRTIKTGLKHRKLDIILYIIKQFSFPWGHVSCPPWWGEVDVVGLHVPVHAVGGLVPEALLDLVGPDDAGARHCFTEVVKDRRPRHRLHALQLWRRGNVEFLWGRKTNRKSRVKRTHGELFSTFSYT